MNAEQEALVLGVRPLAHFIAGRMSPAGHLERDDLAQAGLAQLCAVIDSWHERGPFAPWAGTVMGNAMRRENQAARWRRQALAIDGRALVTRDPATLALLMEYGHAHPIEAESGKYGEADARYREARRLKRLLSLSRK